MQGANARSDAEVGYWFPALSTQRDDTMSNEIESELIAGFVKWAQANAIPTDTMTDAELYEYICRYQKAAG